MRNTEILKRDHVSERARHHWGIEFMAGLGSQPLNHPSLPHSIDSLRKLPQLECSKPLAVFRTGTVFALDLALEFRDDAGGRMNAAPTSFPGCATPTEVGSGDSLTGSLAISQFSLAFEGENFRLEFPLHDLEISLDPEDAQKVVFRHFQNPDWEFYTYATDILENRNLLQRAPLKKRIHELKQAQEGPSGHALTVYGVLGAIVFAGLILWLGNNFILGFIANRIPEQWENDIGKEVMKEARTELTLVTDPVSTNYLKMVADRLVQALPKLSQPYIFYLVDDPDVNAFAVPGGHILVLNGLLQQTETPEELAGVLAHEIAHLTERHSMRKAAASAGPMLAIRYLLGQRSGVLGALAVTSAFMGHQRYSRSNEHEADEIGLEYLVKAGINPKGLVGFFQRLQKAEGKAGLGSAWQNFSSHPATAERVARLQEKITALKYPAYKPFPAGKPPEIQPAARGLDRLLR